MTSTPPSCDFLTIETYQGLILVHVNRERLLEAGAIQAMHDVIMMHLSRHPKPSLILDLAPVAYLSSAALGKLVAIHKTVKGSKGRMAIAGLRDTHKPLFKVTGLDKVFDFRSDAGTVATEWKHRPL